jgi:hypothetical protein
VKIIERQFEIHRYGGKSWMRMPAPAFEVSLTTQDRTPAWLLKNSRALLAILVLPVDRRSNALSH